MVITTAWTLTDWYILSFHSMLGNFIVYLHAAYTSSLQKLLVVNQ